MAAMATKQNLSNRIRGSAMQTILAYNNTDELHKMGRGVGKNKIRGIE